MRAPRPLVSLVVAGVLGACASPAAVRTPLDEGGIAVVATTAIAPTTESPVTVPPVSVATTPPASSTVPPVSVATTTPIAAAAIEYPPQPRGVPFPTDEWPEASLPADIDREVIEDAVDVAFGADDATARVQSVVVVHGGNIVYERYHPLDGPDAIMQSFSVAKSITSALVGIAVADGAIDLDDSALRPEWQGDERQSITLRNLLQMSSGLQWDEVYASPSDVIDMINAASSAAFVAAKPLESPPGTVFEYSTGTTALLVGLVADRIGGCSAATDLLTGRLFEPLGITSAQLFADAGGCWLGGLGANMTARDFARFGLLYLRGGNWDGEQVVPVSWIDDSWTPAPTNSGYGFQWWLDAPGEFSAVGLFGQRILVVPDEDLVIVANSTSGGDSWTMVDAILAEFASPSGGPGPTTTSTTSTSTSTTTVAVPSTTLAPGVTLPATG